MPNSNSSVKTFNLASLRTSNEDDDDDNVRIKGRRTSSLGVRFKTILGKQLISDVTSRVCKGLEDHFNGTTGSGDRHRKSKPGHEMANKQNSSSSGIRTFTHITHVSSKKKRSPHPNKSNPRSPQSPQAWWESSPGSKNTSGSEEEEKEESPRQRKTRSPGKARRKSKVKFSGEERHEQHSKHRRCIQYGSTRMPHKARMSPSPTSPNDDIKYTRKSRSLPGTPRPENAALADKPPRPGLEKTLPEQICKRDIFRHTKTVNTRDSKTSSGPYRICRLSPDFSGALSSNSNLFSIKSKSDCSLIGRDVSKVNVITGNMIDAITERLKGRLRTDITNAVLKELKSGCSEVCGYRGTEVHQIRSRHPHSHLRSSSKPPLSKVKLGSKSICNKEHNVQKDSPELPNQVCNISEGEQKDCHANIETGSPEKSMTTYSRLLSREQISRFMPTDHTKIWEIGRSPPIEKLREPLANRKRSHSTISRRGNVADNRKVQSKHLSYFPKVQDSNERCSNIEQISDERYCLNPQDSNERCCNDVESYDRIPITIKYHISPPRAETNNLEGGVKFGRDYCSRSGSIPRNIILQMHSPRKSCPTSVTIRCSDAPNIPRVPTDHRPDFTGVSDVTVTGIPDFTDVTGTDIPDLTDISHVPSLPQVPDLHHIPDISHVPDQSQQVSDESIVPDQSQHVSNKSHVPDFSTVPRPSDIPDLSQYGDISDISRVTNCSDVFDASSIPDISDIPDLLDVPDILDVPDLPGSPELPQLKDFSAQFTGLSERIVFIPESPDLTKETINYPAKDTVNYPPKDAINYPNEEIHYPDKEPISYPDMSSPVDSGELPVLSPNLSKQNTSCNISQITSQVEAPYSPRNIARLSKSPQLPNTVTYGPTRCKPKPHEIDLQTCDRTSSHHLYEDDLKEASQRVLLVKDVDLHLTENSTDHHTDKYAAVHDVSHPQLVIRRGQSFDITLIFRRQCALGNDDVTLVFKLGSSPRPNKGTSVSIKLDDVLAEKVLSNRWSCGLKSSDNYKSVTLTVSSPPDAIIGAWEVSVQTLDLAANVVYERVMSSEILVLLNPWCPTDDVFYTGDPADLDEYVLNSSGTVFSGTYRRIRTNPWEYGQFEDDIIDICLHLLRRMNRFKISKQMADSVYISRALARIIVSNGERGVMSEYHGVNKCHGGKSPSSWWGSEAILRQYMSTRQAVEWGQCYVFSHLLTTVCRALGLPCRSVTNYSSSFDVGQTMSVDKYFDEVGDETVDGKSDCICNFQTWNEVWFQRPDLDHMCKGRVRYSGWHAVDPSRHEIYEDGLIAKVGSCGPSPLQAIKTREFSVGLDTKFFFSKVVSEECFWVDRNPPVLLTRNYHRVGRHMSTKYPNGKRYADPKNGEDEVRLDVTDLYKRETRMHQGSAMQKAAGWLTQKGVVCENVVIDNSAEVGVELVDSETDTMVGEDVRIQLRMINMSKEKRIVRPRLIVRPIDYLGKSLGYKKLADFTFPSITLAGSRQCKEVGLQVLFDDYLCLCDESMSMKVLAMVGVEEINKTVCVSDVVDLALPGVDIKIRNTKPQISCHDVIDLELSFRNPLDKKQLSKCTLLVEGDVFPAFPNRDWVKHGTAYGKDIGVLYPNERKTVVANVKLIKTCSHSQKGYKILATLMSTELPDCKGYAFIALSDWSNVKITSAVEQQGR